MPGGDAVAVGDRPGELDRVVDLAERLGRAQASGHAHRPADHEVRPWPRGPAGSSAEVRSPSGVRSSARARRDGVDDGRPGRVERRSARPSLPPRDAAANDPAGRSAPAGVSTGAAGRVDGEIGVGVGAVGRVWAPRLSSRARPRPAGPRPRSRGSASSPSARPLGGPGGEPARHPRRRPRPWHRARLGVAQHAGAGGHGPLQTVPSDARPARFCRRSTPTVVAPARHRRPAAADRRWPARRSSGGGRPVAVGSEHAAHGAGRLGAVVRPASIASTTRAPNTMPSSSEFDASRLAPCTPEQATSPAAHRPGSDGGAVEVGDDAAAEVVGGRRDRQPVAGRVEADLGQARRRWSGSARRTARGRWRRARQWSTPCSSIRRGHGPATPRRGAAARRRTARRWRRGAARRGRAAPRTAAAAASRRWCSAVGWNCTNSTSATATPARSAMAMPSPVASTGLVVTANSWPAPPVASSTLAARTSRRAPPASTGDAPRRSARPRRAGRARRRSRAARPPCAAHRVDQRPLDLGAGGRAAGVHDPGQRVAALAGQLEAGRASSRSNMAPSAISSLTRPGPSSTSTRTASASHSPAPAASVSARWRSVESGSVGRARRRRRPGPSGWWPGAARPW